MKRETLVMLRRVLLLAVLFVFGACSQGIVAPSDTPTPGSGGDASAGPVLTWERVGGIAGFCDHIAIYGDGRVVVTTCEGEPVDEGMLSAERRAQLDAWLAQFAAFELEETDPATADAMTVKVTFNSKGSETATDADQQMIRDLAAAVFVGFAMEMETPTPTPAAGMPPVSDEGRAYDAARDALAAKLGVDLAAMRQVEITEQDWPDACLGLAGPDEMCASMITPGFRVVIEVNGTPYVVRTNRDSSVARVEGEGETISTGCLTEFEPHVLAGSDDPDRMTLAVEEWNAYLADMGVADVCIPAQWGAPFVNVDWNTDELPGATGRMLSLGFEATYQGEGWSDIHLLYSTYDFAAGTEYDVFAAREDWDAVQQGALPDGAAALIEIGGVPAFVRFHRGLCYGQCSVFRVVVVPSEAGYVAVVQRLGEIAGDADWEALVDRLEAGDYPEGWEMPSSAMALMLSSMRFSWRTGDLAWEEAVELILDGQVEQVFQTHDLEVTLMLKDGRRLTTIEPGIDDVFAVVERCGDPCEDMVLATE